MTNEKWPITKEKTQIREPCSVFLSVLQTGLHLLHPRPCHDRTASYSYRRILVSPRFMVRRTLGPRPTGSPVKASVTLHDSSRPGWPGRAGKATEIGPSFEA